MEQYLIHSVENIFNDSSTQLFDNSGNAIIITDAHSSTVIDANPFSVQLTGYSLDELKLLTITDLETSDSQHISLSIQDKKNYDTFSTHLKTKSGVIIYVDINVHFINEHGFYIIKDVTEKQLNIENITRLNSIIEKTTDAISITNKEGFLTYLNPVGRKLLGYGLNEDISHLKVNRHATPKTRKILLKTAIPHAKKYGTWHGKAQFKTVKGLVKVSQTIVCHRDLDGKVTYYSSIIRDLSNEYKQQQITNESLALLADAENIAHLGSWQYNVENKTLSWSKGLYRILGVSHKTKASFKLYLKKVSKAERQKLYKLLRNKAERTPDLVHKIHTENGNLKWIRARTDIQYKKDKVISSITGVIQDITVQKQKSQALELALSVINNTAEAIVITDKKNRILQVNNAFEEITGYSESEALGKTPSLLSSGKHDKKFYQEMWTSISTTGAWQGEIWNKRKSGEIYPEWLSINSIFDENNNLTNRFAIFTDITLHKQQAELILYHTHYDLLTNLPNRIMLQDRLNAAINLAIRHKQEVGVIYINVDMFKAINDFYGQRTGDALLIEVVSRLKAALRKSDTTARFGGDEFVVIAHDVCGQRGAENIARSIIEVMQAPFEINDHKLHATVSIGLAIFPQDTQDSTEILSLASQAMISAKSLGRNQYQFFTQSLAEKSKRRIKVKEALIIGIKNKEFYNAYQPIINALEGEVVKFEVLARWYSSKLQEQVSPAEFIAVAEDFGFIEELGEQIARQAIQDIIAINKRYQKDYGIAINRSVKEFKGNKLGVIKLEQLVTEYDLPAHWLTVEITESLLADNYTNQSQLLQNWRKLGAKTAIDDFGTGYSSLSYLTEFPIDIVKIDQSFIRKLSTENKKVVDAIIGLSHNLGLKNIAEGVETPEQLEVLKSLGCDMIQGFFISKPLIYKDLINFIES